RLKRLRETTTRPASAKAGSASDALASSPVVHTQPFELVAAAPLPPPPTALDPPVPDEPPGPAPPPAAPPSGGGEPSDGPCQSLQSGSAGKSMRSSPSLSSPS